LKSSSLPAKRAEAGAGSYSYTLLYRETNIFIEREKERERWEERARNASDARNSASSEWREIEKQQTKRKKGISRAAHAA
jgi:hypothetical protein